MWIKQRDWEAQNSRLHEAKSDIQTLSQKLNQLFQNMNRLILVVGSCRDAQQRNRQEMARLRRELLDKIPDAHAKEKL